MIDLGKPYRFVPRQEWGARPPKGEQVFHRPSRIVLHHSYSPTAHQWNGAATIAAIQRVHQDTNGWDDIAYHYLISPDGKLVFEGRPHDVIGAHCGGKIKPPGIRHFGNTGSIGICCIGDYDHETPDPALLVTLQHLMHSIRTLFSIMPDQQFGHCEASRPAPKTCPGKNLFVALFGSARWEAAQKR